jgi:hypothetical protein
MSKIEKRLSNIRIEMKGEDKEVEVEEETKYVPLPTGKAELDQQEKELCKLDEEEENVMMFMGENRKEEMKRAETGKELEKECKCEILMTGEDEIEELGGLEKQSSESKKRLTGSFIIEKEIKRRDKRNSNPNEGRRVLERNEDRIKKEEAVLEERERKWMKKDSESRNKTSLEVPGCLHKMNSENLKNMNSNRTEERNNTPPNNNTNTHSNTNMNRNRNNNRNVNSSHNSENEDERNGIGIGERHDIMSHMSYLSELEVNINDFNGAEFLHIAQTLSNDHRSALHKLQILRFAKQIQRWSGKIKCFSICILVSCFLFVLLCLFSFCLL